MNQELRNLWCIDIPCYVPKGGSLNEKNIVLISKSWRRFKHSRAKQAAKQFSVLLTDCELDIKDLLTQ